MSDAPSFVDVDGARMAVRTDMRDASGSLLITLSHQALVLAVELQRDQVRDLVQALDDWLFDSRPT